MPALTETALEKRDLLALLDTAGQLNSVETLQEVLTNILKLKDEYDIFLDVDARSRTLSGRNGTSYRSYCRDLLFPIHPR